MPPNISFPIDPLLLEEAEQVVTELADRGITVFHNPSFGIMLIGESLASPVPCKNDMDRAYALHAEIAMLFAIRSIKNMSTSFSQAQGIMQPFTSTPLSLQHLTLLPEPS